MAADCMPVLLADEAGGVVAAAHAGWRGLSAGVIEATVGEMRAAMRAAMRVPAAGIIAWLGPAIGPRVYEVGEEVRTAFLERDAAAAAAFVATRPGHWLLDLYAVARQRLAKLGVERVYGGGLCTYSDPERFYSYRRDGASGRMAALIWLS
jgi:YfiH family protein